MSVDQKYLALVDENYKDAPEYFRAEFRDSILQKKIEIGMWPTEALLAGGGGTYKVRADESVWSKNSNPMQVMRAQSLSPDDSEIQILFYNRHQFDSEKPIKFVASFKRGICISIKGS